MNPRRHITGAVVLILGLAHSLTTLGASTAFKCSVLEAQTIMDDPYVVLSLQDAGRISKIETTPKGYKISTASCSVELELIYDRPLTEPEPNTVCATYRIVPQDKRCN